MMEFFAWLEQLPFSVWVRESGSIWAFPTVLFLHTLGMSMVAGGNAAIDLVILGVWPKAAIKPLERLFPLMWWGFWINAVTGTIMLMIDATTKLTNWDFGVKMAFVFLGIWVLRLMQRRVFDDPELDQRPVSGIAKQLAWASLICWFCAITAGRLLAYVGPVSGAPGASNN